MRTRLLGCHEALREAVRWSRAPPALSGDDVAHVDPRPDATIVVLGPAAAGEMYCRFGGRYRAGRDCRGSDGAVTVLPLDVAGMIERFMRGARLSCLVLAGVGVLAAHDARAGIVAAVNVPVPVGGTSCPQQTDIALMDPATGAKFPLPAGVNTSADELHPSITPNGNRMAFETFDPTGGTTRIRVVDLGTGQQADLFNAFEAAAAKPTTPAITPDGTAVITGVPLAPTSNSQFSAFWNVTSLANFPGGPFAQSQRAGNASFGVSGETVNPDARSDGVLVSDVALNRVTAPTNELLVSFPGGCPRSQATAPPSWGIRRSPTPRRTSSSSSDWSQRPRAACSRSGL